MPSAPFFDLMNALSSLDVDKFKGFEVITADYKIIGQGPSAIQTDVLLPRELLSNGSNLNIPVVVRIHGGFLVTGSSRYAPWFSNWILEYAAQEKAVIVSPNYRLLPEASGNEILQDMDDFWDWLRGGGLEAVVRKANPQVAPDLSRTLVLGESAGGYLAIQLALSYASQIRAVVAAYPMLDLKSDFYTKAYDKPIVGVPNVPSHLIDDHLATQKSSSTSVTAADPPTRLELAFSIVQNGRFLEFLGSSKPILFPMERIRTLAAAGRLQMPPLFILHGKQDSAVPDEGSRKFVQLLKEQQPDTKVQLHIQDGDHGFDADATLETAWLRDGLRTISQAWLNSSFRQTNL